ncbi:MAG: hypothetical protein K0S65_6679, partial [Labilithrix sp.]|nr:hypothetical protein [Labilithrix sp.]
MSDSMPVPTRHPSLELGSDLRITYEIGNEHSPVDLFGRSVLVLEGDGAARV